MKRYSIFLIITLCTITPYKVIAQEAEDVTHYIANAGFDENLTFNTDGTTKNIIDKSYSISERSWAYIAEDQSVYAWAKTKDEGNTNWDGSDGRTHALNGYVGQIKNWTLTKTDLRACEWMHFGILPYDLEEKAIPIADDGNTYQTVPEKPNCDSGEDNRGVLFLRAGWAGECSYKQTIKLPNAKYRFEYWSININPESTLDATNLTNVKCADTVYRDKYQVGLSSQIWTKHEIEFTSMSDVTIELGFKSANEKSNKNPHVFIDGIRLYKIGDITEDDNGEENDNEDGNDDVNAIDCTFLLTNPHFTIKGAEPTYDSNGVATYPNAKKYTTGSIPSDGTIEGWYQGNMTEGDQRLNYAQGRICWNLWDVRPGEHTISQDLTDIPNGIYEVSADLITQPDWAHEAHVYAKTKDADVSSPYLTEGTWNDTSYGKWTTLTTEKIMVADGCLTIGGRSIFPSYSQRGWFCISNFRLYYYGNEVEVENLNFAEESLNMVTGETRTLTVNISPETATFKQIVWETSDKDIVSVDEKGTLVALREGKAVIIAKSARDNNKMTQCTIIVKTNTEGYAALIINEIQSANIDMFVDPSFNYGGWIELYNPTDTPVSLNGMYVSDDANNLQKFRLNIDAGAVPAKGFKNIWFDHHNVKHSQVNFKLDYDGGIIYLSNPSGEIVTCQDYPIAVPRTSYARTENGGNTWGLTAGPTPERDNAGSKFAVGRLDAPVVNKDAQLFTNSLIVRVIIPSGATLRYTTDGTTPTLTNGYTSNGILQVKETTTYRFRLFKDGMLPSPVVTRSYLYKDREFELPIISVVTDPVNLYDDSLGIYVKGVNGRTGNGQTSPCNWNMDWDRPVNFEYITTDGNMVINQEVDMSMCGGWSRAWTPHSFKLKAEKIYEGKNFYDYPVFDSKPYLKHKTLQVRNGGNDNGSRIKDAALQEIVRTSGIDVDGQAYQPAVHFINGNYIGLLNIREPNNKHFVYANYGYDSDEIDMFEMSPDSGYCQMTGTDESFLKWYELSADAASQETYDEICKMVDIDEYINYMAIEMYLGSTDWGRNNLKGYRPRVEDGKFRFVLFDLDFAFDTNSPFSFFEGLKTWTFNEIYDTGERLTAEIKLVTIFLNMLENDTFRKKFIDTFCLVAGSVFEPKRCEDIIYTLAERTYSTLRQEGLNPYNTANNMITSLNNWREPQINAMKNYWRFRLEDVTEQSVKISANIEDARITLNDMVIPTNKFEGSLFGPITLKSSAPAGYKFNGWRLLETTVLKETNVFGKGEKWLYYDSGSLDGKKWTASSFSETWNEGNAPLGYYTGSSNNSRGYNTFLDYGDNSDNKRPTYYFRKKFTIATAPADNEEFVLDFKVDDGFIIYVNGVEAGRYLMPSGSASYYTYASTYAPGNPDSGTMKLKASLFKKGENVIAVEVHNNNSTSTDIYFDASLSRLYYTKNESYASNYEEYVLPSSNNMELEACYEKMVQEEQKSAGVTPVKINEICASNSIYINEHFEKNDWIELYNTTDEPIDVAGMYISDNLEKPQKYQIPADENIRTIIDPHGYLVVWADKLTPVSQLHASFKLGADGGEVVLTSENGEWCDTLIYPAHESDISVGLYPDGGNTVYSMRKQTFAASNVINTYSVLWDEPHIPNSISDVPSAHDGGLDIAFDENDIIISSKSACNVKVYVYTLSGQNCMERTVAIYGEAKAVSLNSLPDGAYIVRVIDEDNNICTMKVLKK